MRTNYYQDDLFTERPKKKHAFLLVMLSFLLIIFTVISVYNMIICSHIGIQRITVTVNALPSKLEGFRILVLSDLHGKNFGINQSELVKLINSQSYDILCIVGDTTDKNGNPRALIRVLEQLEGNKPVLFIAGDEDPPPLAAEGRSDGEAKAPYIRMIEETGAVYLDAPFRYEQSGSVIWFSPEMIYTLDLKADENAAASRKEELLKEEGSIQRDAYLKVTEYQLDRLERIRAAQKSMQRTDIHVALTHVPLSEQSLRDLHDLFYAEKSLYIQGISLVLAGHYNAGQWRLPWGGAFYIPSQFPLQNTGFFVPDSGLTGAQSVVGVNQIITPGLNVSSIYPGIMKSFRMFNQPMLSLVSLTKKIVE